MEKSDLFGSTFDCTCGRRHHIEPREVIYAPDAPERLAAACASLTAGRRVAVLMDVRTRAAAGADVAQAFADAGWQVGELLVEDPAEGVSPRCDDVTRRELVGRLDRPDLVCPVGGGVINDMGKWIAMDHSLPYVCFATAASMNGYASSNISPTIDGVKRLVYGRAPVIVASAPDVLRDAPGELTASGLGDVLAKSVSSADWYLNHLLFGDYYCERSVGLIAEIEPMYLEHPEAIRDRQPEAIAALFQALLLTGAAMTMAETSSPSSGAEHLIGHCLDMMSSVDGAPHDLHGRQVGLGTIIASELYRRVLAVESPEFAEPAEAIDTPFWGRIAHEVEAEYVEKIPRLGAAREKLSKGGEWDKLRQALGAMVRPPERTRDCLAAAGGAYRAEHIGCPSKRLLAALTHAHEIRSRFTVLDLARLTGVLPAAAQEILEQWS